MKEKQKGENCPGSKKRGFDPGAPTGGGKGDDEYKKDRSRNQIYKIRKTNRYVGLSSKCSTLRHRQR